jgi:hypothetical protein
LDLDATLSNGRDLPVGAALDPIDDRDRVESLSPLPRHLAVAVP